MTDGTTAVAGAARGGTRCGLVLGSTGSAGPDGPGAADTEPVEGTPPDVASAQNQLRILQWAVPALTGAMVVLSSLAGEQQRPSEVSRGCGEGSRPDVGLRIAQMRKLACSARPRL